jgi:hypothetical protein
MYKDTESFAYVSDNNDDIIRVTSIFNKIGKTYEDMINQYEQEIDVVSECVLSILEPLQRVYGESGFIADSLENVIYYV